MSDGDPRSRMEVTRTPSNAKPCNFPLFLYNIRSPPQIHLSIRTSDRRTHSPSGFALLAIHLCWLRRVLRHSKMTAAHGSKQAVPEWKLGVRYWRIVILGVPCPSGLFSAPAGRASGRRIARRPSLQCQTTSRCVRCACCVGKRLFVRLSPPASWHQCNYLTTTTFLLP